MNPKEIIIGALNKYQIEFPAEDLDNLDSRLLSDISLGIEEIERQINHNESSDIDTLTLMGFNYSTYNTKVYNELRGVISCIANGEFNSGIAKKLDLTESHVELIQYILCDKGLVDYGTSPRGCWLEDIGRSLFDLMNYYENLVAKKS